jgi:cold shock CspA family protein
VHSRRRDYDADFEAALRSRNRATTEAAEAIFRPKDRPDRPTIEARVKVRFYDQDRRYGFCTNLAGGPDVFLHARVLGDLEITRGMVLTVLIADEPGKSPVVEQILTVDRTQP